MMRTATFLELVRVCKAGVQALWAGGTKAKRKSCYQGTQTITTPETTHEEMLAAEIPTNPIALGFLY